MHIAGGHHHFPQFLAQLDDFPVVGPEVFVSLGLVLVVIQHKAVVGKGLHLQKIIEGGNALEFVVALPVENGLEQLASLTGRADDQALPHFQKLRLGNSGHPAEMLQVGIGDQVIEVPQAHLVLGEKDDVPGLPVVDPAAGTKLHHGGVDGLQGVDVVLLLQHGHELRHDKAAGHGIVPGPVVVEVRQIQSVGHDVQLEFAQMLQKILGEDQGVRGGVGVGQALPLALRPDEAGVEVGIVGNQHPVSHEFQELGKDFLDFRGTLEHVLGDAGQLHDLPLQVPLRVNEGLEAAHFLSILQNHRADLNDPVVTGGQARGFQVEGHEFLVEIHVLVPVDNDPVVHVVDIISFTAVEDLNDLVRSRHLRGLLSLHAVQRVGEGLTAAVVGDGDGPMAPGRRLLDGRVRGGQGIHVGHGGVQVQLHPLGPHRLVLPLGQGARLHGVGLEHHLILKPILNESALNPEHRANGHIFQNGLGFIRLHEAADAHRVGVVRHVEFHHIGIAFFQFLVLHVEDPTLHDHRAHIHGQILHGHGRPPEGLAIEGLALGLGLFLPLFRVGHGGGHFADGLLPEGLHGIHEGLALQLTAGLNGNGDRGGEPLPEVLLDGGDMLQKGRLAVGHQANGQLLPFPLPLGPGERPPGHGIVLHEQVPKLLRLNPLQFRSRVGSRQVHPAKTVKSGNFLGRLVKEPLRDVAFRVYHHMNAPLLGGNVRSGDSRLRKHWCQCLRRLIVRKHLK